MVVCVCIFFFLTQSSPTEQQGILACIRHPKAAAVLAHIEIAQVSSHGTGLCYMFAEVYFLFPLSLIIPKALGFKI